MAIAASCLGIQAEGRPTEEIGLGLHQERIGCHAPINPYDAAIQATVLGHGNVDVLDLMQGHGIYPRHGRSRGNVLKTSRVQQV